MKNFSKKFLVPGIIFCLSFLYLSFGIAVAGVFPDVPEDNVNYKAIEYLKSKNFIGGYSDLTFKPDNTITRAEAVKIIVSALSIPTNEDYLVIFKDVTKNDWFFPYVMSAQKAGIISGEKDGRFRPNDTINLAESLKIMSVAYKVELPTVDKSKSVFADVPGSVWYAQYALYAKDKNILLMDEYGQVHASTPLTRGRFAEIMYRFLRVQENGGTPYPLDENWTSYESSNLPFKVKHPVDWQILNYSGSNLDGVVIWRSDQKYFQSSPERIYPNTAKFVVMLDKNANGLSKNEYFSNVKKVFGTAETSELKLGNFDVLQISYEEDQYIKDWYVYINSGNLNGQVLVIYTQNGPGVLADQNRKFLDLMLSDLEYKEIVLIDNSNSAEDLLSNLKSKILENILVEGQGKALIDQITDKTIIQTDSIGVGTGPIDYYFSPSLNMTLKYERASDVILDYREGQSTAF
jgi:hypothetical protein